MCQCSCFWGLAWFLTLTVGTLSEWCEICLSLSNKNLYCSRFYTSLVSTKTDIEGWLLGWGLGLVKRKTEINFQQQLNCGLKSLEQKKYINQEKIKLTIKKKRVEYTNTKRKRKINGWGTVLLLFTGHSYFWLSVWRTFRPGRPTLSPGRWTGRNPPRRWCRSAARRCCPQWSSGMRLNKMG